MIGEMFSGSRLWLLLLAQSTTCVALGLVASHMLKHHASRAHQVLLIALLAAVLTPVSYLGVRRFELGVLAAHVVAAPEPQKLEEPQPLATMALVDTSEMEIEPIIAISQTPAPLLLPTVNQVQTVKLPWRTILLACCAGVTVVLTARLVLRFILGILLLRSARPVDAAGMRRALDEARQCIGVTGLVDVRAGKNVRSPIIWCWGCPPTLLVPDNLHHNTPTSDWVGVFCHELAHLKRRDHLTGLFAELLVCLAPWHLLLWWARKQLLRFSEEACDDWVLAGGQIGVDYAESLLELSPQPELAFVPTVVGKGKTMKARIHRIVKGHCSEPRVSRRWTLIVTTLILGLAVGISFAQRRPLERKEMAPREQEERELMAAGRRNVLERMLDQLVNQIHETEAALRERGDDPGPDGHVLRAELDALREHAEIVERQLRDLKPNERPQPESDETPVRRNAAQLEANLRRLAEAREDTARSVRRMEMELHELGDGNPEARERLEAGLRKAHMKLDMLAKEIDHFERRRAQIGRRRPEEVERTRADGEHMRNLSRELRELQTHARRAEARLERIDDPDSTEARELHAGLEATRDQMGRVERELSQLRQERGASARARSERGGRRTPEDGPEREVLLRQAYEGLMAQIRLTEDKLKKAEEQDRPEAAERLRLVLEQLHERREALRQEAGRLTEVPRERPGIEVEVEELRGKVDGMHEEMAEMRQMLQQLLEQTRRREPELLEVPESTPR